MGPFDVAQVNRLTLSQVEKIAAGSFDQICFVFLCCDCVRNSQNGLTKNVG